MDDYLRGLFERLSTYLWNRFAVTRGDILCAMVIGMFLIRPTDAWFTLGLYFIGLLFFASLGEMQRMNHPELMISINKLIENSFNTKVMVVIRIAFLFFHMVLWVYTYRNFSHLLEIIMAVSMLYLAAVPVYTRK